MRCLCHSGLVCRGGYCRGAAVADSGNQTKSTSCLTAAERQVAVLKFCRLSIAWFSSLPSFLLGRCAVTPVAIL